MLEALPLDGPIEGEGFDNILDHSLRCGWLCASFRPSTAFGGSIRSDLMSSISREAPDLPAANRPAVDVDEV
jgi:hypothetical protein